MSNGEEYRHKDLEVIGERTIVGSVEGAHLRTGALLDVRGSVTGALAIEEDAALFVQGSLILDENFRNDGVITVAGALDTDARHLDQVGRLVVFPESVVNGRILRSDGNLEAVAGDVSVNVHVGVHGWCLWDSDAGRFVPKSELEGAEE